MVSTVRMQQEFFQKHGEIHDFDDLTRALRDHLGEAARHHKMHGQLMDNRLIGMYWKMKRTTIPYLGESIEHATLRRESKNYNKNHDLGYSGKIWFRLEKEVIGSPSHMFHGSMVHIGTGGYSTWEGPWNEHGRECTKLEQGVPYNLRRPLAAYCFGCHFYISDFPEIDQYAIMQKLSDDELPREFQKMWDEPGLEDRDRAYIKYLKDYANKGVTK